MSEHGGDWQQPLAGTLHLGRTNRWFLGGGKALLNALLPDRGAHGDQRALRRSGGGLVIENGRFEGCAR